MSSIHLGQADQGGWSKPTNIVKLPITYNNNHLIAFKMPLREVNSSNPNDYYAKYDDFVVTSRSLENFYVNLGGNTNFNYLSIGT